MGPGTELYAPNSGRAVRTKVQWGQAGASEPEILETLYWKDCPTQVTKESPGRTGQGVLGRYQSRERSVEWACPHCGQGQPLAFPRTGRLVKTVSHLGEVWRKHSTQQPFLVSLQVSKAARQEKRFQDYNERCTFHHQARVSSGQWWAVKSGSW